jgi:hypothetical protein
MKYACSALISILISSFSCNKPLVEEYAWLNATVSNTNDSDCGYPRLSFIEDSLKIRSITGEKFFLEFVTKGLPEELNIEGNKITVQLSNLKEEDAFFCTTRGISYPAIKIINATGR